MKFNIDPFSYTFAVGKIRALENFLLKKTDFLEMVNLDFLEIKEYLLKNNYYKEKIIHISSAKELENFLEEEERNLDELIKKLVIDIRIFILIKEGLTYPEGIIKRLVPLKSKFLVDFFRYYIDFVNIKTFFSLNREKVFLDDGFINIKLFQQLKDKPDNEILRAFQNTPYIKLIEEGLSYYKKNGTFLYLETLMRSFLIDFIKIQKYQAFGVEPVIAYYLARFNEITLLRVIMLGKILNVDKELLKDAISNTYV